MSRAAETPHDQPRRTYLVEFFGAYGGLLRATIIDTATAIGAAEIAAQEWATAGGQTFKCTGFSVREIGSHAVLVNKGDLP